MPTDPPLVAQTGENVLFAMDRLPDGQARLEAHIQIFYTGPADRFSWVVPVDGEPTLDVGADMVFQVLDRTTRPRFTFTLGPDEGVCQDQGGVRIGFPGAAGSSTKKDAGASDGGAGVDVVFKGAVGPYDGTVIRADDAAKLKAWLRDNDYYLSDQGDKLIDDYLKEGKAFVALKLMQGRSTSEIRPIVLRFQGQGPCVPLRLTAVAANNDLRVNLWVLAGARVVPTNYLEMELNLARIDWMSGGKNYEDLLKLAANEAGGNAFAVEYAGPTAMLANTLVPRSGYSVARLRTLTYPPDAVNEVLNMGLPRDSALWAVLDKYLPEPAPLRDGGVELSYYFTNFRMYFDLFRESFASFDARKLADELDVIVVQPLVKTQALFNRYAKLTRLVTFISPDEMNSDPLFTENSALPDVPRERTATDAHRVCGVRQHTSCKAPLRLELPDGNTVWYDAPGGGSCGPFATRAADRERLDRMPALALAWQRDDTGEGVARIDNRDAIAKALQDQKAAAIGGCYCGTGRRGGGAGAGPVVVVIVALVRRWRRGRQC
jgi:hypothetical protein